MLIQTILDTLNRLKLYGIAAALGEQLTQSCARRMARYKVPRYWRFVDAFPTTVTGKIQKFRMREIAVAELGVRP